MRRNLRCYEPDHKAVAVAKSLGLRGHRGCVSKATQRDWINSGKHFLLDRCADKIAERAMGRKSHRKPQMGRPMRVMTHNRFEEARLGRRPAHLSDVAHLARCQLKDWHNYLTNVTQWVEHAARPVIVCIFLCSIHFTRRFRLIGAGSSGDERWVFSIKLLQFLCIFYGGSVVVRWTPYELLWGGSCC